MYVDKRLAGIQAVQTLSRLNRAHPGKNTTFVLDFANDTADVLDAFKMYFATATLTDVTDPHLVYDLRAKLDATGYYDEHEVERVVRAELNPSATHGDLFSAVEPVVDRLLKRYRSAQEERDKDTLDALTLFKGDVGAFLRLYTFLSQIFDYGNTDIEKRAIFFKRLFHLLEFGRERETVDLSRIVLTHHNLKALGKQSMRLTDGPNPTLPPITGAGTGAVQEKERAWLNEIIEKVNDLFEGDLSDQDKLVYVNNVIKGKLLESEVLIEQARTNTKEQFANSPDLANELTRAIMGALDAHNAMSTQALNSKDVQRALKDVLLNQAQLYESLIGQYPSP